VKKQIKLGLRENLKQFTLLIIINGFVGGMVGLERTILPQLAEEVFGVAAATSVLSFIIAFGIAKAIANYYAGFLSSRYGRKKILVTGWVLAIPIPFLLIYAPSWNWIVGANVLLGIHQGFAWSATIIMKIDLVGERRRGFAMGLNEFAGYLSVAIFAFLTGYIASQYGVRPWPFVLGIGLIFAGLLGSLFLVDETRAFADVEASTSNVDRLKNVFSETAWKNRNLGSITQAGLVNNMNDGMVWGLLPLILSTRGFSIEQIGLIAAIYPAVWGIGQIITGSLADRVSKKYLMVTGMAVQAFSIILITIATSVNEYVILSILLGIGTAMVYPTFLASIADYTHPLDRAQSVGVFRLWRDMGYAIGALATGLIADLFGFYSAVWFIGLLTLISAIVIQLRMDK
jgi:MFS family permease